MLFSTVKWYKKLILLFFPQVKRSTYMFCNKCLHFIPAVVNQIGMFGKSANKTRAVANHQTMAKFFTMEWASTTTNQSLNNKTMRFPWQNNEWWYRYLESGLEKNFTHISTSYLKVMIFLYWYFFILGQSETMVFFISGDDW